MNGRGLVYFSILLNRLVVANPAMRPTQPLSLGLVHPPFLLCVSMSVTLELAI